MIRHTISQFRCKGTKFIWNMQMSPSPKPLNNLLITSIITHKSRTYLALITY